MLALCCATAENTDHQQRRAEHRQELADRGVRTEELPAVPGRGDVDPLLASAAGRLIVLGDDAALNAVALRLLRKQRLDMELAFVPPADSAVASLWELAGSVSRACTGTASPVPLVRDDNGGVVLGRSVLAPIEGRVYCEDECVLAGSAARLEVGPDPSAAPLETPTADPLSVDLQPATDGLRVAVTRRRLLRRRETTTRGRAVQGSFAPCTVVTDGTAHPRTAEKWGWYRHTEDLLLVR